MEHDKLIEALLAKAKALDEKATPGPWKWDMRTRLHSCKLITDHSGQYYVMDFERWGMQDACPRLQVYERYSGPVTKRGSKGMERADKMARSYPGREHRRGYDDYIDHPDAMFIAEARALVPELIEAVETLRAENAEKDKQLAAANKALRLSIATHSTDERQIERLMRHYLAEASGPQEAKEVEHGTE